MCELTTDSNGIQIREGGEEGREIK